MIPPKWDPKTRGSTRSTRFRLVNIYFFQAGYGPSYGQICQTESSGARRWRPTTAWGNPCELRLEMKGGGTEQSFELKKKTKPGQIACSKSLLHVGWNKKMSELIFSWHPFLKKYFVDGDVAIIFNEFNNDIPIHWDDV